MRLERQWHLSVSSHLQHRTGFQGLGNVDAAATRALLRGYRPEAQSLLRVSLTGKFFTEKEQHHIEQDGDSACPFCGQPDGIAHRMRHCLFFQHERDAILESGGCDLGDLPPVQLEHAWAILLAGISALRHSLNQISWQVDFEPLSHVGDALHHLFVDGSCMLPGHTHLRLASWSVVLGSLALQELPTALCSGVLPTIIQTSFRAEIFAFLNALRIVEASQGDFCVWTDCEGVRTRVLKFLDGAAPPSAMASNCDLWKPLWQLLQQVKGRVQVRKVPAHDDCDRAQDVVHEWAVIQNDAADAAAKLANMTRSEEFWALWDSVRLQCNVESRRAETILALHAAVGHKASRSKSNFSKNSFSCNPRSAYCWHGFSAGSGVCSTSYSVDAGFLFAGIGR